MKQKIILKSVNPIEYPDLEVECKVIENDKIGDYLATISDENKFYAHKSSKVTACRGNVGEKVKTVLTTVIDGKEYILHEEENTVKENFIEQEDGSVVKAADIIVTNIESNSRERYIVKAKKFASSYEASCSCTSCHCGSGIKYVPVYDSRLLAKVDENVIIMTSWGEPAVCLKGSYIVTYDAESNDYNTIESGAFNSTYTVDTQKKLRKKRK